MSPSRVAADAAQRIAGRESLGALPNPLGLQGIEFIEYATSRPQALGQQLERLGFRPVARHRSREVLRYRQGDLNVIVNAHRAPEGASLGATTALGDTPVLAAVALRVADAAAAWQRTVALGAWPVPAAVAPMELNIPAIHGVGASRIYFVDRWQQFSIYDVDFVPIPGVDPAPPAEHGLHWFGLVQYIDAERTEDWTAFYRELFGFEPLPAEQRFGVLPTGAILASPCGRLWWQLVEPDEDADALPAATATTDGSQERLQRVAFGTPDVPGAVAALRERGLRFVESPDGVRSGDRGALAYGDDAAASFEFVRHAA